MTEFKFFCPACGQKISCDADYSGAQIPCPTCHKTLTIPAPSPAGTPPIAQLAAAPAPPAKPLTGPPAAPRPLPPLSPPPAAGKVPETERSQYSGLAVASLLCSVWVLLGFIPGIICGHLAKARMRRNIFLEGEKMATAGLIISYCVLSAVLACSGMFVLTQLHSRPIKLIRESPAALDTLKPRIVDEVIMGDSSSEDDHGLEGQRMSSGITRNKSRRSAARGGSFSYTLKVLPNEPMSLNCRYWGGEKAGHTFDVAVEDQIIATQDLNGNAPGHFFDMEYRIPPSLTRGKSQVKVEFQAHPESTAGALFGCQILKR